MIGTEVKDLKSGNEVKEVILEGINTLANMVRLTMGPSGKLIDIQYPGNQFIATKDGVTVARAINVLDPHVNSVIQLVKEVASRTNEVAGDGTTTATVLAQALVVEGFKEIENGKTDVSVKKSIEDGVKEVIKVLKDLSRPITNDHEIEMIAKIAANGEEEVSKVILEAVNKIGPYGVITMQNEKGKGSSFELLEGLQFSEGYMHPQFCTNYKLMTADLENPYILITDKKIWGFKQIEQFIEKSIKNGRSLLVIAQEFDGQALSMMNQNRGNGFKFVAVKTPETAALRELIMEDISIFTGGKYIAEADGNELINAPSTMLGKAKRVVVTANSTTIIGGEGDPVKIQERIENLRFEIDACENSEDKIILKNRLSKLTEGVGIIKIGGSTEAEIRERTYRMEDSLNATRAAMEEGILPGGGSSLFWASRILHSKGISIGNVLRTALEQPIKQICKNAGVDTEFLLNKIESYTENHKFGLFGYDAKDHKFGDMFEMQICDPLKIVRCALETAASIASLLLTTGGTVVHRLAIDGKQVDSKQIASSIHVM